MPDPQAAQAAVATQFAVDLRQTLPSIDFASQWREFLAWLMQRVTRYGNMSATLAASQYATARHDAGIVTPYRPTLATTAPLDQVARTAGWALQPGVAPVDEIHIDRLVAASERLVLDAGRTTIVDNVEHDRRARGWARVTEPEPCAFCALLATRGAVYKSEHTATTRASDGQAYHDNCRCHVEPVFTAYEPPARVREWQAQYRDAVAGAHGSKAAQLAWRRAYEGRAQ